jgi:hypothetical protein
LTSGYHPLNLKLFKNIALASPCAKLPRRMKVMKFAGVLLNTLTEM